jgi:UDP-glucose 4-epimerase
VQVGVAAEHIITEKDPALPTDDYGRAKLRGEKLLAQSGVPFTVLRPAVVYGKGVKGNIAALATLAKTPMPLPFARLTNRRSLLALENLASALTLALTAAAAENETYLVADAEPISIADIVASMREGLRRPPHLVTVPSGAIMRLMKSFGREADWERISSSFVIDASKLAGLGWRAEVTTSQGLARMMRSENGAAA